MEKDTEEEKIGGETGERLSNEVTREDLIVAARPFVERGIRTPYDKEAKELLKLRDQFAKQESERIKTLPLEEAVRANIALETVWYDAGFTDPRLLDYIATGSILDTALKIAIDGHRGDLVGAVTAKIREIQGKIKEQDPDYEIWDWENFDWGQWERLDDEGLREKLRVALGGFTPKPYGGGPTYIERWGDRVRIHVTWDWEDFARYESPLVGTRHQEEEQPLTPGVFSVIREAKREGLDDPMLDIINRVKPVIEEAGISEVKVVDIHAMSDSPFLADNVGMTSVTFEGRLGEGKSSESSKTSELHPETLPVT